MAHSKICFKCNALLPLDEFYKHPQMADGHLNKCKACARIDVIANRLARVEQYRLYDRERAKHPDRFTLAAEMNRRWRAEDKRRMRAHNAVARAIRAGRLALQPCQECGAEGAHAHHDDYDLPLSVRWLCPAHHSQHHKTGG
jgi:hypothetical protein